MSARCKMICHEITFTKSSVYDHETRESSPAILPTVKLRAVMASDNVESEENAEFWSATPQGSVQLHITNPLAAELFAIDQCYYVDFSPAAA